MSARPWSRDDVQHFLTLDVELRPGSKVAAPPNVILGLVGTPLDEAGRVWWDREQTRLVDEAWAARLSHPVYKILAADLNFRAAVRIFEQRRKVAKDGRLTQPTTPFQFLRIVVEYAENAYRWRDQTDSGYGARSKRRSSAIKHAKALCDLVQLGVSLDNYEDTRRLYGLLQKLQDELPKVKRKGYGGARDATRWILKNFARSLAVYCGLQSPGIVTHFARMVDLRCETKTAQRYCAEAKRYYQELMAEALQRSVPRR